MQCGSGLKYFRRNSKVYDGNTPRVILKIKPEALTRENPQLHYILRLCLAETNSSMAITWIKKLDDLHRSHPGQRDEMLDEEVESFGHLAVTAALLQNLSDCLPLPSNNLKKGQVYVAKSNELAGVIDPLKDVLDLSNFAVPIFNLLEPGMAEGAMGALDKFMTEKTGTTMINLYEDLVEKCVSQIISNCQRQKEKNEQTTKEKLTPLLTEPIDQTAGLLDQLSINQRREKHKTRPLQSSVYDTTPDSPISTKTGEAQATADQIDQAPLATFKVRKDTFATFATLFSRSGSHGSIDWLEFGAAMADLQFSIIPKMGSIYEFLAPSDVGIDRSITFHRPHKGKIEGYRLLIFARRLGRVYGWSENSFVVEAKQQWKIPENVENPVSNE